MMNNWKGVPEKRAVVQMYNMNKKVILFVSVHCVQWDNLGFWIVYSIKIDYLKFAWTGFHYFWYSNIELTPSLGTTEYSWCSSINEHIICEFFIMSNVIIDNKFKMQIVWLIMQWEK